MGIYLDNYSSNCFVFGNVILSNGCGVHVNMGKNNVIENNVMVGCQLAVRFHTYHPLWPHMYGFMTSNRFCRNLYVFSGTEGHLLEVNDTPANHPPDRVLQQSDFNVIFGAEGGAPTVVLRSGEPADVRVLALGEWQRQDFDTNSVVEDPLFVDPEHDDYRLRPESPALKLGFLPIDVSQIGIRAE